MAREKVGVTLELPPVWAYTRERHGKMERFGFVMAAGVKDPGGIPYGTFEEGAAILTELLRKAHEDALVRRHDVEGS
jgi:hypothetical protein